VLFLFLVAYWLYIDGVHTVIKMAVDYGIKLDLNRGDLIIALLVTQFVGFPAAIAFGWSGKKIGAKTGIIFGVSVYVIVTAWASLFLDEVWEFYALAIVIGLVQGGVQSLSRSLFARLIPEGKSAEFFGFYNMLGKFAAVLGPLLVGWVALTTGNSRIAIAAIIPLFILGAGVLFFVDVDKGGMQADRMEDA
jgi:UMF1 family MFS transporter